MSGAILHKPAEWHARRAKTIGSSEIAALFDVAAPYQLSRFALFHVKAGLVPAPEVEGERLMWGTLMEEAIAAGVAETKGWVVNPGQFYSLSDIGMSATLDFEIQGAEGFDGPGVLETKNVDFVQHKRAWTGDEPPPHILLQLQHQLACTGWKWGAIACLVGGNRLEVYTYEARPKLIAEIKARVRQFWQDVVDQKPPAVDGSEGASDVLRALYPEVVDDAADMRGNNEWPEVCAAFKVAGERQRESKKEYDAAKNRLVALLGSHRRGWGGGYSVSTAVTPETPDRPAPPGDIIAGRAEARRYTVKEVEAP